MVVTRTVGGFSSSNVSVALVVLVVTVSGTCSVVVVIWTASAVVSEVLLKVTLLPGGGTVCVIVFCLQVSLWC